jgi:hypothetical protein
MLVTRTTSEVLTELITFSDTTSKVLTDWIRFEASSEAFTDLIRLDVVTS